jgi:hypothetical protein
MELPANSGLAPLVCHPAAEKTAPVVVLPGRLTFLEPVDKRHPARKVHRLIQRGDGRAELVTTGYGKGAKFHHHTASVADIDELFTALETHAPLNQFAIRGQVRPDAPAVINRRMAGDDADIQDTASNVLALDLDNEPAPADLDTADIQAVAEYLRTRLPPELRPVSCVVQLSASYGLERWKTGPVLLKARVWFINATPMNGPELRRWFALANTTGCAQMDPAVATANQPIYTAAPLFQGVADPVPQRLALLYGELDEATIRPPAAPEPIVYAPGATGARCPERLALLVEEIRAGAESGQPRHPLINKAAFTAGRYVAGSAFSRDEALAALLPAALATGSAGADRAVRDGLAAGMKSAPILVGVAPATSDPVESPAGIELKGPTLAHDLHRLTKAPVEQCRAIARAILIRYAPQSPRKRPFTTLLHETLAALPDGHSAGLPRSLGAFCDWLERQARQRAVQSSQIDPAVLAELKIEYRRIQTLEGLHSEILQNPDAIHLARAPHGSGKTEEVLRPLSQALPRVCAITNRVSLVADLCHRLSLANYQTTRARDVEVTAALGICLPSIVNPKFNEILSQADGLLIDEISAVLREAHTPGGTLKANGPEAARRLTAMFNQCRVVVGVDADLSTLDIKTIASMTTRKIVVYDMEQAPHDGRVSFADADNIKAQILTAVANGEKCRVACDSSATAIELTAQLRALYPDKNILCIHSRQGDSTAGDPAVINLLRDINAGLPRIDVLIHSPTLESGVSITIPHFTRTFGIFGGRSVAPAGFIQMLKRDRTATHFEIGFAGNCRQKLPTHPREILSALEATHRREVEIIGDSPGASGLIRIEPATPFDERVCQYRAARHIDLNDAANNLLLLLESRGYRIAPCAAATAMSREERQEARRLADEAYREAVLDAAVIDGPERAELQQRYHLNPAETAEAERYDAALANGLKPADLTPEALRLYEHGRLLGWNRRFDLLNAAPLEGLPGSVSDADYVPALTLRRFDLAASEAYRTLFDTAGLDWRTGKGEVDAASALDCWRDLRASACRPVLEHTGVCRFDAEPAYPVRWLGDALRKFGLALEAAPSDRTERGYTLQRATLFSQDTTVHAPGLEVMQRLWQTRQERRNILEANLPARTRHPMQPALV